MIQLTIGSVGPADADDVLGRERVGYYKGISDEDLYEAARAAWLLGADADQERYALVVHRGVGRQVIEIQRLVPTGRGDGRRVIEGAVLRPGHPAHDAHVGEAAPLWPTRNPVRYFRSETERRFCACGCGEVISRGTWASGHDQQALHDRVRRGWGDVAAFVRWFDRAEGGEAAADTE